MSKEPNTPFPVNAYPGPERFCDREEETDTIVSALRNGRHQMIYSPRRYGKTGLIHHAFNRLGKVRGARVIFADIYAARNAHEFNTTFLNAVHKALNPTPKQFLQNAIAWLSALRPVVHEDDLTGQPSIALEQGTTKQEAATTRKIFRILNEQDRTIFLAFDEFQQITAFKDIRMDAVLRTELQASPKVHCIFSGSQRHLLLDLFLEAKSPFFASADHMELERIPRQVYASFAVAQMKKQGRSLALDDALYCYDICRGHTYYVQVMYNRLFSTPGPLDRSAVVRILQSIIRGQDAIMATLRGALTRHQWDLFAAIAREGEVDEPTAWAFLKKHDLSSSATVVHALRALQDRELVYITGHNEETSKPIYAPYNPFLAAWFKYR